MKTFKSILVIGFLILICGKYFNLFDDYSFTESFSLYDLRYLLLAIYVILSIKEYREEKRNID